MEYLKKDMEVRRTSSLYLQLIKPLVLVLLITQFVTAFICAWMVIYFTGRRMMENASNQAECAAAEMEKYAALPSLVEYWSEHANDMQKVYDDSTLSEMEAGFRLKNPGLGKLAEVTRETYEELSEEDQGLFAEIAYGRICESFSNLKRSFEPMYIFSFIIRDDKLLILTTGITDSELRISQGGEIWEVGVITDYVPGIWENVDGLLKGEKKDERYHVDLDSLENGAMATEPIYVNGELTAFVSSAESYSGIVHGSILIVLAVVVLVLVSFLVLTRLIMNMIKKKVVIPIKKEENAIRDYMDNKDSSNTVKILDEIRSGNEVETLAHSFSAMITELDNHVEHIKQITAERERISAELSVANRIQADMLPRNFPEEDTFDLYAVMHPAKEVAGDFYDFFFTDEDHLVLVIGDVSGKSVPAALFMANSRTVIKNIALTGVRPSEIMRYANDALCDGNDENMFVTIWLAMIDLRNGHAVTVNAGHEHPMVLRRESGYEMHVYSHNAVLGVLPSMNEYTEIEYDLENGDGFFVYTDGIPEAQNDKGEFFEGDRIVSGLNSLKNSTAKDTVTGIYEQVVEFENGTEQFDDITMLCFRYFGGRKDKD